MFPKGSAGETPVMTHDPRPHIHRRRHAIGRLRSLTAGAAIAGVAGVAGFGALAATSWSGTSTTGATDGATTTDGTGTAGTNGTSGTSARSGTTGTVRPKVAPNTGGAAPQPTAIAPRVQRGSGSGHASTGGSH